MKSARANSAGTAPAAPQTAVETRRTILALVASWAVPGSGHLLLGRPLRGAFFALVILTCFTLGLAHDGRLALRTATQPFLSTMQVVANAGVGVADVVARLAIYGEAAYALPTGGAPTDRRREVFQARLRSRLSPYGTAYLWTAGLMNLMLLFDVLDLGRRQQEEP